MPESRESGLSGSRSPGPEPSTEGEASTGHRDIRYSREMGVTDDDFWRILPKAMGEHDYRIDGRTVRGSVDGGTVEIVLGPQQERRIALLRLPFSEVSFTFRGVSADDQQAFKRHFDLYFQRGGG